MAELKPIARFIVPSRYQVEKWGRSEGDISVTAVTARVQIEGRYSIAFPAPTTPAEAYDYNEMAEHIVTLLNDHEARVIKSADSILDSREPDLQEAQRRAQVGGFLPASDSGRGDRATPLVTPITATLFHGETRHEFKAADGRIILITDVLPEHAQEIQRRVNGWEALRAAIEDELEALRVWLSNKNNASDDVREGMLISRSKLRAALADPQP